MANKPACMLEFVVAFSTEKYGHRILGKIMVPDTGVVMMTAREQVIELLLKNGIDENDILPIKGDFGTIDLYGGDSVVVSPLVAFEDYAGCVAEYKRSGHIVDLNPSDYVRLAGTLAKS